MKNRKNTDFRGNTISSRLLICFLVSTLIPTILITALMCLRYDQSYRRTALDQMEVSRSLIGDYLNSYFTELNIITTAPYYHSYFSSRVTLDEKDPGYIQEINAYQEEMRNLINLTTYSHTDISDLIVWSEGHYLYHQLYNELWYFNANFEEQPWFTHAMEANGKTVFTPTIPTPDAANDPYAIIDTTSFYVTRKIRNLRMLDQKNIVVINLNSRTFDAHLQDLNLLYDSFVVITNDLGDLIYASRPLTAGTLTQILNETDFHFDSSRWNRISSNVEGFPLRLHVVYSLDDVARHTVAMTFSAMLFYLGGLLIAFALFRSYNKWIGQSTGTLLTTFAELEDGNLETQVPPVDVEEFNQIGESVNAMITQLNEKIKNEYLMTIQQKSIQLYALQSQIQPHFLINTIYCFIALNQIGEKEKLNSGFFSLAHLLRYVLSKEKFTTIGKEQRFLADYLKLQQLRFGQRLSYEMNCPEEYKDLVIPRLLLQPLVENAIIHGIEPCEHPCTCRIRVERHADLLHIYIEDNGVGFDPDEIARKSALAAEKAFQHDPHPEESPALKSSKTSIGLYYVKERLRMWSEQATLDIHCDHITCAEIQIPWEELTYESTDR
ncbi:MAG: histidine kinase [Lachnospiraceae bacterium]|nr:histidine kinase [Lachnospiraceae bacterium]